MKAKNNNTAYRKRNREYFNKYKQGKGCAYCGYNANPIALDFHHLGNKDQTIARMVVSSFSIKRIMKEVEKCVVLCAICHRIEHDKLRLASTTNC